ncbi:DUF5667 domain-containing protein [Amycolatopsis aidingensis]|uniref:DUF5667 domain-containing protein n=1 Tax=Amycolatopsis aidingensis TaxID=2842453 RepID=UPI001C0E11FF|nr:DUF5667 domain-containing protein [Amycolatopsis aidingensis]
MSGFHRFSPRRAAHERFARAVDAAEGDRAREDTTGTEEFGAELAVVSALRDLGATAAPEEQALARMADRIRAGEHGGQATEFPAAPESPAAAPRPPEPEPVARVPRPRRRPRPVAVLAGACCLLLALGGLALMLSRDALPGDTLYDIKRVREAVSLGLTFDEEARGRLHLEYAAGRLAELARLTERTAKGATHPGYRDALADFDADARSGVARMVALGTSSSGTQLDELRSWASAQADRLNRLRAALPADAVPRGDASAALVHRIGERATALAGRMGCTQITSGRTDELGALPAPGPCAPPGRQADRSPPELAAPPEAPRSAAERTGSPTGPPAVRLATGPAPVRPEPPTTPELPAPTIDPTRVPPAPLPTGISRPRLPDSVPEPPALLEVPPLLPVLPEVRIG